RRDGRYQRAIFAPRADAAVLDVAAADHDVERLLLQRRKHAREQRLVMLEIGVDDGDIRRGARQNAFDAGRRQAAARNPVQQPDAAIVKGEKGYGLRGSVTGIVIDEDQLPVDASERARKGIVERYDVVALVPGRRDHSQLGPGRRLEQPFEQRL